MASLTQMLPAPARAYHVHADHKPVRSASTAADGASHTAPSARIPAYGERGRKSGGTYAWLPRSQADFADGGAYPELHVAQFPLDMRGASKSSTAIVSVKVDAATGAARFDAVVSAQHGGRKVYSQFSDMVEKSGDALIAARPSVEEETAAAATTRAALEGIVNKKISTSRPGHVPLESQSRAASSQYIRYTPAEDAPGFNPAVRQRVIRMVDAPVDPMEPAKHKHKKLPGGPPAAPVPLMHSPPRKLTLEDQANWSIPPCISGWKNNRGHIVPLDKRQAADGRSLLEPVLNDKFAKFSEGLLIGERKAREEVEARAAVARALAMKQKEGKEAELRALAAKARAERGGFATLPGGAADAAGGMGGMGGGGGGGDAPIAQPADSARRDAGTPPSPAVARSAGGAYAARDGYAAGGGGGEEAGEAEREELRRERKRLRERELRMEGTGPGAKRPRVSEEERDVSERVALGMPATRTALSGEAAFDSRLFNQSEGISSGFGADDDYNVYSKPWQSGAAASTIYRPRATGDAFNPEAAEEQLRELQSRSKFSTASGADFEGVSAAAPRRGAAAASAASTGPVQFERAAPPSAATGAGVGAEAGGDGGDLFGIDQFLTEAKRGPKAGLEAIGKRGFMAAAAGGVSLSAADYDKRPTRDIKFVSATK